MSKLDQIRALREAQFDAATRKRNAPTATTKPARPRATKAKRKPTKRRKAKNAGA